MPVAPALMILFQIERHDSELHRPCSAAPHDLAMLRTIPLSRRGVYRVWGARSCSTTAARVSMGCSRRMRSEKISCRAAAYSPPHRAVWISAIALRPDRHPLRRSQGSRSEPAGPQSWGRPGQAGVEAGGPRQARDGGPIEWQPPLTSIAAPGIAARSPSRWRATLRHASRCIRARRQEPRSDAAGR